MSNELELTRDQIEIFAAGLYQLALCDGVDDSEISIIKEFCEEVGVPELANELDGLVFDPATAYSILGTSWLHKIFLESALLVVRADGKVSDAEREMLSWMAMAFGVAGGYDAVEQAVAGQAL